MSKILLLGVAAAALLGMQPVAQAATVVVENVGSVINESKALPAEATPGVGVSFAQFFEFSLPTTESVTASVSDSGVGSLAVLGGVLNLNFHTTTGVGPLFIPAGALIDSSPFTNTAGGQEATVGPQILTAGNYFVDVTGTSGASPIHLAIDGTVTALATPEPSTWAMLGLGFGMLAFIGRKAKRQRLSLAV
jgi:PEP-CTERM motif